MLRTKHKKGKLEQERIDLLNTLPSWTFNRQADRWTEMHDTASHWLKMRQAELLRNEKLVYPSKSSFIPFDRKVGQWLANQRQELSTMSAERAAMVQNLRGWSRQAASGNKRTASKASGTGKVPRQQTGDSGATRATHFSCGYFGKRLRTKTSLAKLNAEDECMPALSREAVLLGHLDSSSQGD